jgi:hypothetical protein
MTPCPRCSAPVLPQARFCSECGTWVVHTAAGLDERAWKSSFPPTGMPAPPPVDLPKPQPLPEFAGTLPASAAMIAAMSMRSAPAPAPEELTSRALPPAMSMGAKPVGATQVRTLDTGRPPPPEIIPTQDARPVVRTSSRTIVDDRPPVSPSRSVGRTPRPLGAFLISYQYEPLGTFWPLAAGTNIIGRAGAGRPDIDVGIADTTVSTEQALIDVDPRGITVEDRSSRNGTSINGRPIAPGVRVPVVHGDRVTFGSFETILVQVPYPAPA